jgi:hypothetical protein
MTVKIGLYSQQTRRKVYSMHAWQTLYSNAPFICQVAMCVHRLLDALHICA